MKIEQQAFSAAIRIFPFKRENTLFTCISFYEPFTREERDELICAGLSAIAEMEDSEKDTDEQEPFDIELSRKGLAQCPWDGPPHLALICGHSVLCSFMEAAYAKCIKSGIEEIHQRQYTVMSVPRMLFQALERLPQILIVKHLIPPVSVN